jgi:hypothetical protein
MAIREVYLDNDWEFEFDVKRKATTTGTLEAAASLSGVSAFFSLTDGGTAVGSTTTTLSERSATAGRYFGLLDKATLNTAMSAYVDTVVYEVFVVSGDAETSEPILVKGSRRPA